MAGYGAIGAISVTANVLPAAMAEFCQAFSDGDDDKARTLDAKLQPIHEALFMETSPIPTKWVLNAMGRIDVGIRLPLVELTAPVQAEVRRRLETFGRALTHPRRLLARIYRTGLLDYTTGQTW